MSKINILIVDDHPIIVDGLEFFLGHDPRLKVVGTASNGRSGLKQIMEKKPDVVVLDLSLPDIDGLQAMQLFLESRPDLKVVIFSVHSDESYVFQSLKMGARGYVLKKESYDDLKRAIQHIHSGGCWVSPEFSKSLIEKFVFNQAGEGEQQDPLAELTTREKQVFRLMVSGSDTAGICDILCISEKTVSKHRSAMMSKLKTKNLVELTKFAIKHKLIEI